MRDRNLLTRDMLEQREILSHHVGRQDFAMSDHSDDCSAIKVMNNNTVANDGDSFPRVHDGLRWIT